MTVSLLFAMMIFAIVGATTPGPVNLIATSTAVHQLGFADQAHFQRQFKRKLSVTPKYYQSHFIQPKSSSG
ncbi:hypothetical protein BIY22_00320 [Vibrio panuliri]|uniref:HTH araC/xylS-type domain-containing protein n=1 Tax=Vibrio panuliri TaxID=1381081 RepID=A0A1Q9HQ25_9VIBR|nr:hypothetical protein BIY22_00320 [Vibrio panuliri]